MPISASNYDGTQSYNVAEMGDLCKPNLLINPDFKINQRGETSYTSAVAQTIKIVYSVDRWCLYGHSLTVNSDKSVTITPTTYSNGSLIQNLETPVDGDITVQVYAVGVSGTATVSVGPSDGSSTTEIGTLKNGLNTFTFSKGIKRLVIRVKSGTLTLKYAKVEQGKVATSFVAPNPAEELVKCERFLLFTPSSMVGYRFDSYIYVYLEKLKNMRTNGTCSVRGINNDTSLLANGEGQNGVILGSGISVSKDKQFIRIDVKNISPSFKTKVLGIDMNKTDIIIDSEIY